ncbi:hypothetical protein [Streptomyces sp. MJM1172]|uniref:hypothetical protein n=1 Tax=Streptomyces sp. MJM1172 TaxID=1703926 RepID=UPI000B058F04|nr:hypothetical protein [Streptomyces sp. MJM1172]
MLLLGPAPVGGALAAPGGLLRVRMLADPVPNLLGQVFLTGLRVETGRSHRRTGGGADPLETSRRLTRRRP